MHSLVVRDNQNSPQKILERQASDLFYKKNLHTSDTRGEKIGQPKLKLGKHGAIVDGDF